VSDIVWLASYPKSGNTWLRVLLANYLRDASEPADTGFARRCTAAWPWTPTRRCS